MNKTNHKRKDWSGSKFYRLELISPTTHKEGKSILWKALCDCGNFTTIRPDYAKRGLIKSCGCFRKEGLRRKYAPEISSARNIWQARYSDGCSFETFYELSQKPCYYCNSKPIRSYARSGKNAKAFVYNGLDRLDSNLSHIEDNLVPCCFDCNKAKSSLTVDEFFKLITRIANHHNLS